MKRPFSDEGKVLACGDNRFGQTVGGQSTTMNKTPVVVSHEGPAICRIACGSDFSVMVDLVGGVFTWGEMPFDAILRSSDGIILFF